MVVRWVAEIGRIKKTHFGAHLIILVDTHGLTLSGSYDDFRRLSTKIVAARGRLTHRNDAHPPRHASPLRGVGCTRPSGWRRGRRLGLSRPAAPQQTTVQAVRRRNLCHRLATPRSALPEEPRPYHGGPFPSCPAGPCSPRMIEYLGMVFPPSHPPIALSAFISAQAPWKVEPQGPRAIRIIRLRA